MSRDPEELRRQEFLERAEEAERRAAKAVEAGIRESWLKVAEGIAIWPASAEACLSARK